MSRAKLRSKSNQMPTAERKQSREMKYRCGGGSNKYLYELTLWAPPLCNNVEL